MRPQYFVFEWLLMSALLYYNKFYDIYSLAAAPGLNEGIAAAAVASVRVPKPSRLSWQPHHVMTRNAADKFRIKHYDSSLLIYFSPHDVMMANSY